MSKRAAPLAGRERRSPTPAAAHKREAIHHLKAAVAEGRILLHYQPLVRPADGRTVGAEALMRWKEPRKEGRTLTELILNAERSPVIFKLENLVLEDAFRAAAGWAAAGLDGVRVNVNLSAREFPRADLVRRVTRRLRHARLSPATVGLEITETSSIQDYAAVAGQMDKLIGLGIEIWLDDFGTGHSSLEWLMKLPVHGVKIPGTFVERLRTEKASRAIVARVIDLARDLGLRVIAEGVEHPEQRDFLVERGCDLLQGFLLYAPMAAEELPPVLAGAPA
jgi:EAL domain-containing protein (putative c-di-GMP-specific phosphodiesterase class I)